MTKKPSSRERGETRERRRAQIAAGVVQRKPVKQIAGEVGLSREWVSKELNSPETQHLIRTMLAPHRKRLERIVDRSIAAVERALTLDEQARLDRINALTDRIARLRQVIAERAEHYASPASAHSEVPGMRTGVVVHREKIAGSGDNAQVIDEYEVDTGMLKELREHERQLREELNDFTPNLKAVERARDLLEMAEGKRTDDASASAAPRGSHTLQDWLVIYAELTRSETQAPDRPSD